jgi:hypothetical protein
MLKKVIAILCVALITGPAAACDEDEMVPAYEAWVPEGWMVLAVDDEDVNGDGIPDASLLLEAEGCANVRRFMVLLGTGAGGYEEMPMLDVLLPSAGGRDASYRIV